MGCRTSVFASRCVTKRDEIGSKSKIRFTVNSLTLPRRGARSFLMWHYNHFKLPEHRLSRFSDLVLLPSSQTRYSSSNNLQRVELTSWPSWHMEAHGHTSNGHEVRPICQNDTSTIDRIQIYIHIAPSWDLCWQNIQAADTLLVQSLVDLLLSNPSVTILRID